MRRSVQATVQNQEMCAVRGIVSSLSDQDYDTMRKTQKVAHALQKDGSVCPLMCWFCVFLKKCRHHLFELVLIPM